MEASPFKIPGPPQIGYRKPNGGYMDISRELLPIWQAFTHNMLVPQHADVRSAEELNNSFRALGKMLSGSYP